MDTATPKSSKLFKFPFIGNLTEFDLQGILFVMFDTSVPMKYLMNRLNYILYIQGVEDVKMLNSTNLGQREETKKEFEEYKQKRMVYSPYNIFMAVREMVNGDVEKLNEDRKNRMRERLYEEWLKKRRPPPPTDENKTKDEKEKTNGTKPSEFNHKEVKNNENENKKTVEENTIHKHKTEKKATTLPTQKESAGSNVERFGIKQGRQNSTSGETIEEKKKERVLMKETMESEAALYIEADSFA